jgi:vacuolar-type H+-ATPase subunit H
MHPDLDAIVSSDEEARARVALAENRRERDLSAARAARDAAIEARRREADESFQGELQSIRAEGDARVAEIRRQQEQYLTTLAEAGERTIDDAVALYLRIVCEEAP